MFECLQIFWGGHSNNICQNSIVNNKIEYHVDDFIMLLKIGKKYFLKLVVKWKTLLFSHSILQHKSSVCKVVLKFRIFPMPPRKRHYFHGRRRGEPPKDAQGDDLIHLQIHKSKHPFEENGFISQYTLTPSQKAITCAIRLNGGFATEAFLLQFLQKHWDYIGKMNTKLPNNIPDARILRINLAVKKKGVPLFIRNPENNEEWTLNTSTKIENLPKTEESYEKGDDECDKPEEPELVVGCTMKQVFPLNREVIKKIVNMPSGEFETLVLKELESAKEPLSIDDLASRIPSERVVPGAFASMQHERRIRAVLIMLKQYGKCVKEGDKWKYHEEEKVSLPGEYEEKKDANISSLSLSEFYEMTHTEHV